MKAQYRYYDFIVALFVCVLMLSNLLSSARLIDTGLSIGGFAFAFDAGTLVFPISYIFGDILTEIYGYKRSRRVIWSGFIATALMAGFIWLARQFPPEAGWASAVGDNAYDAILGGIGALVIASLIAYLAGEFANSYVLARMKVMTQGRWLWTRTIGSTLVGEGIDTLLFFLVSGALGAFPWSIIPSLMVTNYILKVGFEVILTPVTIRVVNALKRAENEDVYDVHTDFNPFRLDV